MRSNGDSEAMRSIHLTRNADGTMMYVPPRKRSEREALRSYAQSAMYSILGDINDPDSLGIPLATPSYGCNGGSEAGRDAIPPHKCPRTPQGGMQSISVAPLLRNPKREASSIVSMWTPAHYHKFFCAHDRFRGLPCGQCGRGKKEADRFVWPATL